MNRTYKIIASRGAEILFDDRLQAVTPRQARSRLKEMLGLRSLSGVVYSITEIPVDLIRGIVDARVAELAGGASFQSPLPADLDEIVMERLQPILQRLAALDRPSSTASAPCERFDPLAAPTLAESESSTLPTEAAPPEPDWGLVRRHYRRYRSLSGTAAKYGVAQEEIAARASREAWLD